LQQRRQAPQHPAAARAVGRRGRRPAVGANPASAGQARSANPAAPFQAGKALGAAPALAGCATPGRDPCRRPQLWGLDSWAPRRRAPPPGVVATPITLRRGGAACCNAPGWPPDHKAPEKLSCPPSMRPIWRPSSFRWFPAGAACWRAQVRGQRLGPATLGDRQTVLGEVADASQPRPLQQRPGFPASIPLQAGP